MRVADVDTRLRERPSLVASPHEPPELGPRPSLPRTVSMGTPCLPSAPLHLVGRVEAGVRERACCWSYSRFTINLNCPGRGGECVGCSRPLRPKGETSLRAALAPPASFHPRPCPLLNCPPHRVGPPEVTAPDIVTPLGLPQLPCQKPTPQHTALGGPQACYPPSGPSQPRARGTLQLPG